MFFFVFSRAWDKEKQNSESPSGIEPQTFGFRASMLRWIQRSDSEGSIPRGDSEFFSLSHARDKTKKKFLCVYRAKKLTISLISIYKWNNICCRNNTISNLNKNSSICLCCSTTRSFKCGFFFLSFLFLLKTWLQMGRVKLKNLVVPLASRLQLWLNYAFENSLLTISSFLIIQLCYFFLRPTKRFVVFVAWVWRLSLVIWFILSSQLLFVMSTLFWLSVVVT